MGLKVQHSFKTTNMNRVDESWHMIAEEPAGTLFDADYVQNGGKNHYRKVGKLSKNEEDYKIFNDLVLQKDDRGQYKWK